MAAKPLKVNLTTTRIEALTCPAGKSRLYVYDAKTPALTICVTRTGSKSWYLYRRVHGSPERIRLGSYPQIGVYTARQVAEKKNADIANGLNPQEVKRTARGEMTLKELFDHYLENHLDPHSKPKTRQNVLSIWNAYLTDWANRRLSTISRQQVQTLHIHLGKNRGKVTANRAAELLRAMFNYAIDKLEHDRVNPARRVTMFKEKSRDRFLQPDEMEPFFKALDDELTDPDFRDMVLLLLFVGARRGNIQAMRWDDISLDRMAWTIPDTKSGESVVVPLSDQAVEVLQRRQRQSDGNPWVFPGPRGHAGDPKKRWTRLMKRAGISDLVMHDLRRSLGSWQAGQGTSLNIIGKSLGHKSTRATAIYARLDLDPVRVSVNKATAAILRAAAKVG